MSNFKNILLLHCWGFFSYRGSCYNGIYLIQYNFIHSLHCMTEFFLTKRFYARPVSSHFHQLQ